MNMPENSLKSPASAAYSAFRRPSRRHSLIFELEPCGVGPLAHFFPLLLFHLPVPVWDPTRLVSTVQRLHKLPSTIGTVAKYPKLEPL